MIATTADSPRRPTPPPFVGPYRVERVIAQGGMGVVCEARDHRSGDRAAVKCLRTLDSADLASFRREVHTLRTLRHPGVVRVLDHGVADGAPWYAMDLIEGPTLRQVLGAPGGHGLQAPAIGLVGQLCETLAFLHGEGIVHRDLKPENVVVAPSGTPVIVDFGLVARFAAVVGREALEVGGEFVGSVAYMAPEQITGDFVDARADLYAVGCLLYEVIAGAPPFEGDPRTVVQRHLNEAPTPLSARVAGVPAALDEL